MIQMHSDSVRRYEKKRVSGRDTGRKKGRQELGQPLHKVLFRNGMFMKTNKFSVWLSQLF